MKLKQLATGSLLAILSLPSAFAQGSHSSGGGHLLRCTDNGSQRLFLRDVYEGMRILNTKPSVLGAPELDVKSKLGLALSSLAIIDPERAKRYLEQGLKMLADIDAEMAGKPAPHKLAHLSTVPLGRTYDDDSSYAFPECAETLQFARQSAPDDFVEAYYLIDKSLWLDPRIDNDTRTELLTHELVYFEARQHGADKSRQARIFNVRLLSGDIARMKSGEYYEFLKANLPGAEYFVGSVHKLNASSEQGIVTQDGEIKSLNSSSVFAGITLSQPCFSNDTGSIWEATIPSDLAEKEGKIVAVAGPYLANYASGGKAFSVDESTIRLELNRYENGVFAGVTELVIDDSSKIKSRKDLKFLSRSIPDYFQKKVNSFLQCSRDWLKERPADEASVANLIEESRGVVSASLDTNNEVLYDAMIDKCKKREVMSSPVALSQSAKKVVSSLTKTKALECKVSKFRVGAAVVFGAMAGVAVFDCRFSDGSERVFAGPTAGVKFAYVVTEVRLSLGKEFLPLSFDDHLEAQNSLITKFGGLSHSAEEPGKFLTLGSSRANENFYGRNAKDYGIALPNLGFDGVAGTVLFKLFRKGKNHFEGAMTRLYLDGVFVNGK